MKVLIVSDTHGIDENFFKVLKKEDNIDFIIHAGDTSGSFDIIKNNVTCPVKAVLGNNDFDFSLKREEEFFLGAYKILLTHGHMDGVYYGTDRLIYKAAQNGAQVVIYGHTHVPRIEYDEDLNVYAINPGSLTYPRQSGHKPSYIIMNIDEKENVEFTLKYL